jgi:hypothetical protein
MKSIVRALRNLFGLNSDELKLSLEKPAIKYSISHVFDSESEKLYYDISGLIIKKDI